VHHVHLYTYDNLISKTVDTHTLYNLLLSLLLCIGKICVALGLPDCLGLKVGLICVLDGTDAVCNSEAVHRNGKVCCYSDSCVELQAGLSICFLNLSEENSSSFQ